MVEGVFPRWPESTDLRGAADITFDAAGNLYMTQTHYSSSDPSSYSYRLAEFAAGASGNVAPIRTLDLGKNSGAFPPQFDGAGNMYLYFLLGNDGARVLVYARDASGTDPPIRTITFPSDPSSRISYSFINTPIQVSAAGDIYVLAYNAPTGTVVTAILHYPPGVSGIVATPITTITSSQFDDGSFPNKITLH